MADDFHIIYNPHAKRGGSARYLQAFTALLDTNDKKYTVHPTSARGHATQLTKQIITSGGKHIIILGGDGTIHEVMNGYAPGDDVVFGILPAGTGNDVATMLGLPMADKSMSNVAIAAKGILAGKIKCVDYIAAKQDKQSILFFSYGIAAQMVISMEGFWSRSKLSYYKALIKHMFGYKPATYEISIDNAPMRSVKCDFLGFHNCIHGGGGMQLVHNALIDDGFSEVFIVQNRGFGRRVLNLLAIMSGKIHRQPNVEIVKAKTLTIDSPRDDHCCVDGEVLFTNRLDLKVVHKGIKIFSPYF
ncbi:MAG: diacylglycerol kinase family lipid kinase [Defluviitaleaceae bacterium]|nr:diacylglycerol kinase family lipid kinase [Defluviitaleaceae bacterium]